VVGESFEGWTPVKAKPKRTSTLSGSSRATAPRIEAWGALRRSFWSAYCAHGVSPWRLGAPDPPPDAPGRPRWTKPVDPMKRCGREGIQRSQEFDKAPRRSVAPSRTIPTTGASLALARVLAWSRHSRNRSPLRKLLGRYPDDAFDRAGMHGPRVVPAGATAIPEFRRAIAADSTDLETRNRLRARPLLERRSRGPRWNIGVYSRRLPRTATLARAGDGRALAKCADGVGCLHEKRPPTVPTWMGSRRNERGSARAPTRCG